jgi:hypothetical protein
VRAGDRQRGRAQRLLRTSYLHGELSADTFEARLSAVLAAQRVAEIDAVQADLPTRLDRVRRAVRARLGRVSGWEDGPSLVAPDAPDGTCLLLGRALTCDVRFAEPSVSRCHAELRRAARGWLIVDRASTNGTWVNGRRVDRAHVGDGDVIVLGNARVVLRA